MGVPVPPKPYKPLQPPIGDPDELLAYSGEHVRYEVDMFFGTVDALSRQVYLAASSKQEQHVLEMTLIEAFILHLRNLISFLYPDNGGSYAGDVLAWHFLSPEPSFEESFEKWRRVRPALSHRLERAKVRANQELAHLTKDRIAATPTEKAWLYAALGDEMRQLLTIFIASSDPARLSSAVRVSPA